MADIITRRDWVVSVFDDGEDEERVTDIWTIQGRTEHEAQNEVEGETDDNYTLTPAEPWHIEWASQGDDIACPNCGKRRLQTQDRTTVCLACGWQADNPVAL